MKDRIKDFLDKHIQPFHAKSGSDKAKYLDMEFVKNTDSYFTEPTNPRYLYLTEIDLETEEKLQSYLVGFWNREPELAEMIPALVKLALSLREEHKEESAELSPFVYAMF